MFVNYVKFGYAFEFQAEQQVLVNIYNQCSACTITTSLSYSTAKTEHCLITALLLYQLVDYVML